MKNTFYLLLFVCIACNPTKNTKEKPASPTVPTDLASSLDAIYNAEIDPNEPGASLLVAYDGEVLIGKGFGMRDAANGLPITRSTNMRMASVSKQFTALNVLTLVDEGLISLSDPAIEYLPYPIFEGITVEMLANHTSGLPDYYSYFQSKEDQIDVLENQDVLDWLATGPDRVFEPGTEWEYSNTAYLMLALIVEKVSETEFSAYAKKNVFEKAGMAATNYYNLARPIEIPERAWCYDEDDTGELSPVDGYFMNGVMGDGAVYTSINDYFNYDQALRNQSIVSPEIHQLIFKPSSSLTRDGVERFYAMGWGVTDSTAQHSGGWYGTNTLVRRYLDRPLTIAIFANRTDLNLNSLMNQTDSITKLHIKAQIP